MILLSENGATVQAIAIIRKYDKEIRDRKSSKYLLPVLYINPNGFKRCTATRFYLPRRGKHMPITI